MTSCILTYLTIQGVGSCLWCQITVHSSMYLRAYHIGHTFLLQLQFTCCVLDSCNRVNENHIMKIDLYNIFLAILPKLSLYLILDCILLSFELPPPPIPKREKGCSCVFIYKGWDIEKREKRIFSWYLPLLIISRQFCITFVRRYKYELQKRVFSKSKMVK